MASYANLVALGSAEEDPASFAANAASNGDNDAEERERFVVEDHDTHLVGSGPRVKMYNVLICGSAFFAMFFGFIPAASIQPTGLVTTTMMMMTMMILMLRASHQIGSVSSVQSVFMSNILVFQLVFPTNLDLIQC